MPRFSERVGAVKAVLQVGSMNEPLKNSIWNFIRTVLVDPHTPGRRIYVVVRMITSHVLRRPVDEIEDSYPSAPRDWLFARFKELEWWGVYEVLEYVVTNAKMMSGDTVTSQAAAKTANSLLEREHSGYRFVAGELAPITSPAEIAEVERAVDAATMSGLGGAREHIRQALGLFGKRPDPDYRNAIKEAISAVESAAQVISGKTKASLDDALKAVTKATGMHPAMMDAFRKLYGYTSDEKGIRHALLDETTPVDEEEARFMIVACSAFLNLLIVKADKAGLLLKSDR